jgi:hypothetical protein
MIHRIILAAVLPLAVAATPAFAQEAMKSDSMGAMSTMGAMGAMDKADSGRLVAVTIENLTTGQGFSPAFFATHGADAAPLFKLGEPASEALWNVAEAGNIGPFSGAAAGMIGTTYGAASLAIHTPPGASRTFYIRVDEAHPLLSGVFMLGMTNDGFSGVSSVDAYDLTGPMTVDALAYDAGSEKNSEKRGYLGALGGGNMRDPENGVVTRHTGIRGDADAPAEWKFDPAAPVARITLAPVDHGAM